MQNNIAVVNGFITEVINEGRIDACGKFFWDNMVEQVPLPGQGPGIEGLKEMLTGYRAAFPDVRWTIDEQVAEGDKVVTRFTWTGTHRGEFLGVPATGRPVSVWGVVIDRLEGGKIKDTRIIMDTLGLMMQFGVIPTPGA
ncbi:ester cyclase [Luteolibacter sp. Populi]|uniref:ester cyclase n=1 Tax=Luteolibacter sp. Populi TaxID=3230487 RepID=UPI003467A03A